MEGGRRVRKKPKRNHLVSDKSPRAAHVRRYKSGKVIKIAAKDAVTVFKRPERVGFHGVKLGIRKDEES